jgi:hypothetical protein
LNDIKIIYELLGHTNNYNFYEEIMKHLNNNDNIDKINKIDKIDKIKDIDIDEYLNKTDDGGAIQSYLTK